MNQKYLSLIIAIMLLFTQYTYSATNQIYSCEDVSDITMTLVDGTKYCQRT